MISQLDPQELEQRLERLLNMIVELKEEESLGELSDMLEKGVDPKDLLACFMEGMHRIGLLFEEGSYFIAALIMAGEIMRSAMETLKPYLTGQNQDDQEKGRIILGTIQGDIHDLGKNLFALLLNCNNFEVIDLGVDVPAETFLEKAKEISPDIIGISCVLTNSVDNLKAAVELFTEKLPAFKDRIVIGGTCLDQHMAAYIGTTNWAKDAVEGLRLCQELKRS